MTRKRIQKRNEFELSLSLHIKKREKKLANHKISTIEERKQNQHTLKLEQKSWMRKKEKKILKFRETKQELRRRLGGEGRVQRNVPLGASVRGHEEKPNKN
ncbi:uncharacterized protein G2W53_025128 [Senna tora]|uniref:Uncharacterized protein n=1 Tax=Senna tora TaxID=362788 RepID=A0A834TCH9_9FABA|nr:uncharacterized protein G2W53_025128 [Senna tora]